MAVPTRQDGQAWDLRDLCNALKPVASWNDIAPHRQFEDLPVVNLDLLAHTNCATSINTLYTIVRLNQDYMAPFFESNPLTKDGSKGRGRASYKPPQRHRGNQTLTDEREYRVPFLDFFRWGQGVPVGATDVGEVTYGTEPITGVADPYTPSTAYSRTFQPRPAPFRRTFSTPPPTPRLPRDHCAALTHTTTHHTHTHYNNTAAPRPPQTQSTPHVTIHIHDPPPPSSRTHRTPTAFPRLRTTSPPPPRSNAGPPLPPPPPRSNAGPPPPLPQQQRGTSSFAGLLCEWISFSSHY